MKEKKKPEAVFSVVLEDGGLAEMVFGPESGQSAFAVSRNGKTELESEIHLGERLLVPYSAGNNLLTHEVVLLPSELTDFGSEEELVGEIREFIHTYVDLEEDFEDIAAHYVLFTWVHDRYNELPYLRVRGDLGSGKSRFLLTVGSICYRPIFASGASTVSPLFRMIDAVGGTLVIDEGDFRFSDEKSEIAKIFNNGNVRGFPVLRTEITRTKEFNPRAFKVFGPKLIGTRGFFEDRALESRCLSAEMGRGSVRSEIPLNLPDVFKEEARKLRNKLLSFRFSRWREPLPELHNAKSPLEPRVSQIFAPLFDVVDDEEARERISRVAKSHSAGLKLERSLEPEAELLSVVRRLKEAGEPLYLKRIAEEMRREFGEAYDYRITPRWVGTMVRRRLLLRPEKSNGNFLIPLEEYPALEVLFERYCIHADSP